MVTRFGLLVQISTARPSVPRLEHHGFVARSQPDHPVLDCTTGISQSLALSAVVSEEGRARVLWCADARTLTVATHGNRNALWTGATFSVAWGIPLLPLTPGGVRNGLATFLAGRYRTPEQHVSEVQRGDTILTSQVPDPATELSIRERVFERASAAVFQPSRRTHSLLNFCSLSMRAGWTRRSQKVPPLLWCA